MKCRKTRDNGENVAIMRNVFSNGNETVEVLAHSGSGMINLNGRLPPFLTNSKRNLLEEWKDIYRYDMRSFGIREWAGDDL